MERLVSILTSRVKALALSLGLFHLAVVASGAVPRWPAAARPLLTARDVYTFITGAGGGFGFFSPGVGNELSIYFLVEGREIRLDRLVNQEVALRLGNMYRLFAHSYGKEEVKRSVAASLATSVFRRFPGARETTLIARLYRLPSLEEYRAGKRPEEKEMYRVTFRLSAKAAYAR